MEIFLKKMVMSSFYCVNLAFHIQVSLSARGRQCPPSIEEGTHAAASRADLHITITLRKPDTGGFTSRSSSPSQDKWPMK